LQRKYTNSKKFEHFFNKILKVLFWATQRFLIWFEHEQNLWQNMVRIFNWFS
jgi:hypothetical protein